MKRFLHAALFRYLTKPKQLQQQHQKTHGATGKTMEGGKWSNKNTGRRGGSKQQHKQEEHSNMFITPERERMMRFIWTFLFFSVPTYLAYDQSQDIERVVQAIERGSHSSSLNMAGVHHHHHHRRVNNIEPSMTDVSLIDRSAHVQIIKDLIMPKQREGPEMPTFCIIAGCTGSGKTTLMEQVARELGSRFIFIPFDEKGMQHRENIIQRYAKVLNYQPLMNEEDLPIWKPILYKLQSTVSRKSQHDILSVIKKACTIIQERDELRAKNDPSYRPIAPVFCFDNVNALATSENSSILIDQFEASKDAVDRRLYSSIYTLNDEKAYSILEQQEGFSRVNQQIEIGGVSHEEAKQYLARELRLGPGCEGRDLDRIVSQCCGGHLLTIQQVIYLRNCRNFSADNIILYDIDMIATRCSNYSLHRKNLTINASAVWRLLSLMVKHTDSTISEDEAKEALQIEVDKDDKLDSIRREELVDTLLQQLILKNILARDVATRHVYFHHPGVRTFVRNELLKTAPQSIE